MSMMEGSNEPFPNGPEQGVDLTCDSGHSLRIYLRDMTEEMATDYAGIIDGSSPMYVRDPRTDPTNTWIGRCTNCGSQMTATPFGFGVLPG